MPEVAITANTVVSNESARSSGDFLTNYARDTGFAQEDWLSINTAGVSVTIDDYSTVTVNSLGFAQSALDAAGTAPLAKARYVAENVTFKWVGATATDTANVVLGNFLQQGHLETPNCDWIFTNTENLPTNGVVFGAYAPRILNDGLSANFTNNKFVIPEDDTPSGPVFWQMAAIDADNITLNGVSFEGPLTAIASPGLVWVNAQMNGGSATGRGDTFNYRTANFGGLPQQMSIFAGCAIGAWSSGIQTLLGDTAGFQSVLINCDIRTRDAYGRLTGGDLASIEIQSGDNVNNHRAVHLQAWKPRFVDALGADVNAGEVSLHLDGSTNSNEWQPSQNSINLNSTTFTNLTSGGGLFRTTNEYFDYIPPASTADADVAAASGGFLFRRRHIATGSTNDANATLNLSLANRDIPYYSYEKECYQSNRQVATVTTGATAIQAIRPNFLFDTDDIVVTALADDATVTGTTRAVAATYLDATAVDTGSKLAAGLKYYNAVESRNATTNYRITNGIVDFAAGNIVLASSNGTWTDTNMFLNSTELDRTDIVSEIRSTGTITLQGVTSTAMDFSSPTIMVQGSATFTGSVVTAGASELTWTATPPAALCTSDADNVGAELNCSVSLPAGTYTVTGYDVGNFTVNRAGATGTVVMRFVDCTNVSGVTTGTGVVSESSISITGGTGGANSRLAIYQLGAGGLPIETPVRAFTGAATGGTVLFSNTQANPLDPAEEYRVVFTEPGRDHFISAELDPAPATITPVVISAPTTASASTQSVSATIAATYDATNSRINYAIGSASPRLSAVETNALFESAKASVSFNYAIVALGRPNTEQMITHTSDTNTTLQSGRHFLDTSQAGTAQQVTAVRDSGTNAITTNVAEIDGLAGSFARIANTASVQYDDPNDGLIVTFDNAADQTAAALAVGETIRLRGGTAGHAAATANVVITGVSHTSATVTALTTNPAYTQDPVFNEFTTHVEVLRVTTGSVSFNAVDIAGNPTGIAYGDAVALLQATEDDIIDRLDEGVDVDGYTAAGNTAATGIIQRSGAV